MVQLLRLTTADLMCAVPAYFSQDGGYVICGSENGSVYIWNKARYVINGGLSTHVRQQTSTKLPPFDVPALHHSYLRSMSIMKSSKQDRNASYEFFTGDTVDNTADDIRHDGH